MARQKYSGRARLPGVGGGAVAVPGMAACPGRASLTFYKTGTILYGAQMLNSLEHVSRLGNGIRLAGIFPATYDSVHVLLTRGRKRQIPQP